MPICRFFYGKGLAPITLAIRLSVAPDRRAREDPRQAVEQFSRVLFASLFTWNDLAFLREKTKLPILLKGILSG